WRALTFLYVTAPSWDRRNPDRSGGTAKSACTVQGARRRHSALDIAVILIRIARRRLSGRYFLANRRRNGRYSLHRCHGPVPFAHQDLPAKLSPVAARHRVGL